ncbi:MAG: ATP-dependent DNA helicase RecQ [Candidatus Sericytochromatia bacterium]|nr:ATP-dependent DNA helicase RecQ [Candidatus Sericytochromatia bacterium]
MDWTHILSDYWGPDFQLRGQQPEIVSALLNRRDVLALLPTGEGKSLCFQLAGLTLKGLTLVISPLVALMQDQVQGLQAKGIPVAWLHGQLNRYQRDQLLQRARQQTGFIYLSPELLQSPQVQAFFSRFPPGLLVIDEAHCISQWGHDFRPDYRRIPDFIQALPQRPVIGAFTATAPPEIAADIVQLLGLSEPLQVRGKPLQAHIYLRIQPCWTPWGKWRQLLRQLKPKTLIYANTRQETEQLARRLQARLSCPVLMYHAGCPAPRRQQALESFATLSEGVMVATKAFGMGIDIGDIERVIHWQLPESLSAYVQEVGRAGRNRQVEASAVLLRLWGEPFGVALCPLRADHIWTVLRALQRGSSLPALRQRYQLPDAHLNQILLPLERQGCLQSEAHLLQLDDSPLRPLFSLIWRESRAILDQHKAARRLLAQYCQTRHCRRTFLYRAFALTPEADCDRCDRCQPS